jgi:hypothetical protein
MEAEKKELWFMKVTSNDQLLAGIIIGVIDIDDSFDVCGICLVAFWLR